MSENGQIDCDEASVPQMQVTTYLGYTSQFWDRVMLWSLAFAAIAAVLVALTTVGSWKVNKREQEADRRTLQQFQAKAAVDIAKANAQAADARLETARISLELEKTKNKLNLANAIVPLDDDVLRMLVENLRQFKAPEKAYIFPAAPNDREAQYIANQIDRALTDAGIPRPYGQGSDDYIPLGTERGRIVIAYGAAIHLDDAERLAECFSNAGLPAGVTKMQKNLNPIIEDAKQHMMIIQVVVRPRTVF